MKIIEVKLRNGLALCACILSIQGTEHRIEVNVAENDFYVAANQRGQDSWENEDVETVVSRVTGLTCTF